MRPWTLLLKRVAFCSNTATRRRLTPKTLKNSFQKLCDSARSDVTSAHSLAKARARARISLRLKGMRIPLCGRIQARRLGWPYQPSVLASSAAGLIRPTQPTFSLAVSRRTWLGSLLATLDWCVLPITVNRSASPHEDPPRRRDRAGGTTGPRAPAGIARGGAGGGAHAAAAGAAASRAREAGGGLRRAACGCALGIGRASCRERVCQYV